MAYDVDLFVIGGGSGGVRAARFAGDLGARVALCEERWLGGTCVNVGCVPKKLLVYASRFGDAVADGEGFGWSLGEATFDWAALIAAKDREISRLNGIYARLLERAGVTVYEGRGVITGPHEVTVNGQAITAERILIATGGWPRVPTIPGAELGVTSNEMFSLPALPKHAVIVGGGYIAVEFASILRGLGSEVTLLVRGARLLRGFDQDISTVLCEELGKRGVDVRFETQADCLEPREDGRIGLDLDDRTQCVGDLVLFATGRGANTRGLGLETVGVRTRPDGSIPTLDADFRTNVPSIHAVGDVRGEHLLTPVALEEGMVFARRIYGGATAATQYNHIATAVFSQPNVGTVGLTETEARQDHDVAVYRSRFRPMFHTLSGRDEMVMMKLVVDRKTDKVLGCHMVGEAAGELVQCLAIALNAGATKSVFDATIGVHPTAAEEFVTMRTPVAHS